MKQQRYGWGEEGWGRDEHQWSHDPCVSSRWIEITYLVKEQLGSWESLVIFFESFWCPWVVWLWAKRNRDSETFGKRKGEGLSGETSSYDFFVEYKTYSSLKAFFRPEKLVDLFGTESPRGLVLVVVVGRLRDLPHKERSVCKKGTKRNFDNALVRPRERTESFRGRGTGHGTGRTGSSDSCSKTD